MGGPEPSQLHRLRMVPCAAPNRGCKCSGSKESRPADSAGAGRLRDLLERGEARDLWQSATACELVDIWPRCCLSSFRHERSIGAAGMESAAFLCRCSGIGWINECTSAG